MKFIQLFAAFSLFFSLTAQATVESNRIWVELDDAQNVVASRSIELFVLREGYGNHIVSGFDKYDSSKKKDTYDLIMLDFESYSDFLVWGSLYDGQEIITFTGLSIKIQQIDANGDGQPDTKISVKEDSLILLNVKPNEIRNWQLMGG
jgi:hypothetical protein